MSQAGLEGVLETRFCLGERRRSDDASPKKYPDENRELRKANEILEAAGVFVATTKSSTTRPSSSGFQHRRAKKSCARL